MSSINVKKACSLISLDAKIQGNDLTKIERISDFNDGKPGSIVWVSGNDVTDKINFSEASVIICDESVNLNGLTLTDKTLIITSEPRRYFFYLADLLYNKENLTGIDKSAIVHPEAIISSSAYIGPNCVVGKSKIGDHCIIMSNVIINDNVLIYNNVLIKPGAVIGTAGFGYFRNLDQSWKKNTHIGRVIINENVELGSNSCVDRGTLGDTIIESGSKIDNLVHIGHNVKIGKNVLIAAETSIGGGSRIGSDSEVWMGVKIASGVQIGKNTYIGMGSVVIDNVPENKKCFGNPARVFSEK